MDVDEELVDREDVVSIMFMLADIRMNTLRTAVALEELTGDDDGEEEDN